MLNRNMAVATSTIMAPEGRLGKMALMAEPIIPLRAPSMIATTVMLTIFSVQKRAAAGGMTNKEIIQDLYQAFASGDVPAVVAKFDDNISWTEADGFPLAGTYIGPQAVVESVFMRLGEFSDNWGVVERLIADGDTVVADGKYTWNHKESGEPCEVRMAHVWTLIDGKATAFLQHVDSAVVRELIK